MTNSADTTPATAEPLLTRALDTLGKEIVSGAMAAGHVFTLHDLSSRFNISRTVSREVMRALEQMRLVTSSRRVGIKVLPATEWDVFDQAVIRWRWENDSERQLKELSELRYSVEPVAAVIAARCANDSEIQQLISLAETMVDLAQKGESEDFLSADMKFHTLILEASRNDMFRALAHSILHALEGRTVYGKRDSIPSAEAVEAHLALAEAIAAHDPQGAERASRVVMGDVALCDC